ncbi:MAG TPA: flavin prenyltransferase UbiX [Gemmatimonadales bacterium]|nr:flavin prenyltransferase UbiX [Gemmatimonadales bacterium]
MTHLPVVHAITGASGAPYGLRLLQVLAEAEYPVWLIVSAHGWRLLKEECGIGSVAALRRAVGAGWKSVELFTDQDRGARPASGSARTAGMVICPCSMATLAGVATGNSRSLIERSADVTLKERRRLILVPREAPLSLVHLRNMVAVTEAGATVIPAAPGFYHRPKKIEELVDFVVQRVLDHLGVEVELVGRWTGRRGDKQG